VGEAGVNGVFIVNFFKSFIAADNRDGWSMFLKFISLTAWLAVGDNGL